MSLIWLTMAIVLELGATLSLRASDGFRKRAWILPVVGGYAGAIGLLMLTLNAGMPVGVAYGIWIAAGTALVAVCARAIWNDPLTKRMTLGILVATGVVFVEMGGAAH